MANAEMEELAKTGSFRKGFKPPEQTEEERRVSEILHRIGRERGIDGVAPVALAYLFAKYPLVFPVVGLQSVQVSAVISRADIKHLHDNIQALTLHPTCDEVEEIDGESYAWGSNLDDEPSHRSTLVSLVA